MFRVLSALRAAHNMLSVDQIAEQTGIDKQAVEAHLIARSAREHARGRCPLPFASSAGSVSKVGSAGQDLRQSRMTPKVACAFESPGVRLELFQGGCDCRSQTRRWHDDVAIDAWVERLVPISANQPHHLALTEELRARMPRRRHQRLARTRIVRIEP